MPTAIAVGSKSIVYEETPPLGSRAGYRHFRVTVNGIEYELTTNPAGEAVDQPILRDHSDVVREIFLREF